MKMRLILITLICLAMLGHGATGQAQGLSAQHLADHGLPAGPAREVLPGSGALIHLQVHDLLGVLEGIEEILVAGIPDKAAPPDVQGLLQTEHPLLTLLGMQTLQQPLTSEVLEQATGIDTRGTVGLTLYLGDPRRMFVLSLPTRSRSALVPLLNAALQPSRIQEINISGKKAVRMVSQQLKFLPELYLVSSSDTLYVCGDRSLVQALYVTPAAQRFGQDPFMSRALSATDDKQVRVVLNPAMAKPLALQLQGISMFGKAMIPQQRAALLERIPPEIREQIEMQVRMQLGVRDLEQFADYAECILVATLEQLVDFVSGRMLAFEGFTLGANLGGGFVEFSTGLHSNRFQAEGQTKPLPMEPVRQALAWLGPDYQSFTVTGQKPQTKEAPVLSAWTKRVQQQCQAKGLAWPGLARFVEMLEGLRPVPTVESRTPWVLSTYAPLHPAPSLLEAASLEDYFISLDLPVYRPVKVTPDQGRNFLEACFREETQALNTNRELGQDFANTFQKQNPWCLQENRFGVAAMDGGITRYTRESVWTTRTGLFGYDQHELVNRKVVHGRHVGDYLVYHRGAQVSSWLPKLRASQSHAIAPGVVDLLDRVPEGANYVSVQRVLQHLPRWVNWIGILEARLHADAQEYLKAAQAAVDSSSDLEAAKYEIQGMKMPPIIGSVNINPRTNQVYALLPAGNMPLTLPRPKVLPLVLELFADYAAQADKLGGSLVYTKVGDGSYEFAAMQSTAALTTLTRTVGNALFENYLASQEQRTGLQRKLSTVRDGDRSAFDEVVARNPQWAFIPQPKPKVPAEPSKKIPARAPGTDARLIDLSQQYNAALNESWHKGGMSNNSLKDLPTGKQTFDGTSFDVRGIIQLSGRQAEQELGVQFPEEAANIVVGQKAQKIHFLHGCGWLSSQGTAVGTYVIHYSDGQTRSVPIVYGVDVRDWWLSEEDTSGFETNVVWTGTNHSAPDSPPIGVCKTTWVNPLPNVAIDHIDYQSTMENSAPFLIAMTVDSAP
jgi:hypothetical protein